MKLTQLPGDYAVARSGPATPVPEGFLSGTDFLTISRTDEELSLVGPTDAVTKHRQHLDKIEPGWTTFKVQGPFAFDETGIVAALSRALAEAEIGIFVISTYDTDYILVKEENAQAATRAWRADGHAITVFERD
ncbi:MAG: ACT domain-containing protein [Pseudomonadota bacterium]